MRAARASFVLFIGARKPTYSAVGARTSVRARPPVVARRPTGPNAPGADVTWADPRGVLSFVSTHTTLQNVIWLTGLRDGEARA